MTDETRTGTAMLPSRANLAMLTLQLRAALQEADETEAAADALGADGDVEARVRALVDERRRALAEELASVRDETARMIDAAHVQAAEIVAAAGQQPRAQPAAASELPPAAVARPVEAVDPQAIAVAIAIALAERFPQLASPAPPPAAATPAHAPTSFWSHLWHADVVLAVGGLLVVLIVLLAWVA